MGTAIATRIPVAALMGNKSEGNRGGGGGTNLPSWRFPPDSGAIVVWSSANTLMTQEQKAKIILKRNAGHIVKRSEREPKD